MAQEGPAEVRRQLGLLALSARRLRHKALVVLGVMERAPDAHAELEQVVRQARECAEAAERAVSAALASVSHPGSEPPA